MTTQSTSRLSVAVIGLGVMGEPMAHNLVRAGFTVCVYNRTAAKCEPFRGSARIATSANEAIAQTDVSLIAVDSESAIDAVLSRGSDGVIAAPVRGKLILNAATISPPYSQALGESVTRAGGRYVEAPVSGSRAPAESGELLVLAGGDDPDLDTVQPILDAIGKTTVRCGPTPHGAQMKLAINAVGIVMMEGLCEATLLAKRCGLDVDQFFGLVLGGQFANDLFRAKIPKLRDRDWSAVAASKHVAKDIRLIHAEGQRVGIHNPAAALNTDIFRQVVEQGLGDEDVVAVLKWLESGMKKD